MAGERKGRWGGGQSRHSQRKGRQVGEKTGQSVAFVSFALNYLYNEEREQIPSCRGVTLKVLPVGRTIMCSRTLAIPGGAVT